MIRDVARRSGDQGPAPPTLALAGRPRRRRRWWRRAMAMLVALAAVGLWAWLSAESSPHTQDGPAALASASAPGQDGGSGPSGQAMPTGSPAGWHRVLADNFNGSSLGRCWGAYQGVPPSSPTSLWEPNHVTVSDGMAHLQTYRDPAHGDRWVTGGMSSAACLRQTYGRYEIRFRMTRAAGVKYAILLWPSSGDWPCDGEIDFGEDEGGDRTATTLTNIYCARDRTEAQLPQTTVHSDFSRWQTLGLQWTPGSLVWTLNGHVKATVHSDHIPADPMEMDVQTETNSNCSLRYYTCLNTTTPAHVDMDIDWIVAYRRSATDK